MKARIPTTTRQRLALAARTVVIETLRALGFIVGVAALAIAVLALGALRDGA